MSLNYRRQGRNGDNKKTHLDRDQQGNVVLNNNVMVTPIQNLYNENKFHDNHAILHILVEPM